MEGKRVEGGIAGGHQVSPLSLEIAAGRIFFLDCVADRIELSYQ